MKPNTSSISSGSSNSNSNSKSDSVNDERLHHQQQQPNEQERRRQDEMKLFSSYAITGSVGGSGGGVDGVASSPLIATTSTSTCSTCGIWMASTTSSTNRSNDSSIATSTHLSQLQQPPLLEKSSKDVSNRPKYTDDTGTGDDYVNPLLAQQQLLGSTETTSALNQRGLHTATSSSTQQEIPVTTPSLSAKAAAAKTTKQTAAAAHHMMMNMTTHTLHHSQHSSDMKAFTSENNNGDITTPLFAEQVICHRPLFFGPIISPSVLQKAQQMVIAAISEQQLVHNNPTPVLQDLPDPVRNVVGALRTYGYGLDKYVYESPTTTGSAMSSSSSSLLQPSILLKGSSSASSVGSNNNNNNNSNHSESTSTIRQQKSMTRSQQHKNRSSQWWGNGTVSTFQPVWGTDVRAERLQTYLTATKRTGGGKSSSNGCGTSSTSPSSITALQRPKVVSRVSTAPALLSKSPDRHVPQQPTNHPVNRKYKYDANDDDDDDDDDENDDVNTTENGHDSESYKELATENENFESNLHLSIPHSIDRQSSVNTISSNSSKISQVIDTVAATTTSTTVGTNHDGYILPTAVQEQATIVKGPVVLQPPTPNEQFTSWLRYGTQQSSEHQDFTKLSKSPSRARNLGTGLNPTMKDLTKSSTTIIKTAAATSFVPHSSSRIITSPQTTTPGTLSVLDQDMFSRWVQAGNNDSTPTNGGTLVLDSIPTSIDSINNELRSNNQMIGTVATTTASTTPGNYSAKEYDGSAFQRLPDVAAGIVRHSNYNNDNSNNTNESDNDSLIDDEQNTQVGANDNLNKAIAMISDGNLLNPSNDMPLLEPQSQMLLSQVDGSRKRPMTNYELTGGYVPMFGVDDPPLPQLSDLGTYETEEDQQRAMEQKRSQDIIEKFVPPNVFGSVACPNSAIGPDDFHSWHSRSVAPPRNNNLNSMASIASDPSGVKRTATVGTSIDSATPLHHSKSTVGGATSTGSQQQPVASKTTRARSGTKSSKESNDKPISRNRYGWWYEPNEVDDSDPQQGHESDGAKEDETTTDNSNLQLPPFYHSSNKMQVLTSLEPNAESLRKENLPLSHLHAATSMVQALPYLSDRPHSHRYLQIDTKQIAFPPLQGEIEPLFCSLAIYNVETISSGNGLISSRTSSPPLPDLQRCGRVTEALQFDHVTDPDVESSCKGALWPYLKSNTVLSEETASDDIPDTLRGTSCGVFPLPSNLNVANLYAVLIIRKVLSEEADFEPYLKLRKTAVDLEKLKQNAERASNRNGTFVVPFAFGVAPLLQVFGSDNPTVALSRAVQIPLFHFSDGERQIIDHIMVMLFPRADRKLSGVGGPAPVTNGGTAMLVMRNFGYLGLHHVVNNKSSLARHRLVDFTGELQVRRRTPDDPTEKREKRRDSDNYRSKLPPWHPLYITEPVHNGGRITAASSANADTCNLEVSRLYAQELAPIPLLLAPTSTLSTGPQAGMAPVRSTYEDIESFYHTTFTNELICHPRILHNCEQGHYAVKVELREIEWNDSLHAYLAHLPRLGINPCIHNPRRGPFLVQSSFTSCTAEKGDNHFIDEFKIKLPLDLTSNGSDGKDKLLSLFFTVYRIKTYSNSKWKRGAKMLFGSNLLDSLRNGDAVNSSSRAKPVACGFLPIAPQSFLLSDGVHDVRVAYLAQSPPAEICNQPAYSNSLMLVEREINKSGIVNLFNRESVAEELPDHRLNDVESSVQTDDSSTDFQSTEDPLMRRDKNAGASDQEHVSLSVRIISYSSLHSQNHTLTKFLNQESDPLILPFASYNELSALRIGEEYMYDTSVDVLKTRVSRPREEQLLDSVVAISDSRHCPIPLPASHLLRLMPLLWRTFILGDGEPDFVWSDPAASIPLRVHTFATILHLVGAISLYLAKNGYTQVDGKGKFSFVFLGRVLALLFDEYKLFGTLALETFDLQHWSSTDVNSQFHDTASKTTKKSPPKGRHVRQHFQLGDGKVRSVQNPGFPSFSSTAGDLATPSTLNRIDSANVSWSSEIQNVTERKTNDIEGEKAEFKVDSKNDFQNLMRLSAVADDDFEMNIKSSNDMYGNSFGVELPTKALIQAYGGISGVGGRRYMTMPTPLSTILESSDDLPSFSERTDTRGNVQIDSIEFVVRESVTNDASASETKQMRRPKVVKAEGSDSDLSKKQEQELSIDKPLQSSERITSDEILASMGDAYLDKLATFEDFTGASSNDDDKNCVDVRTRVHRRQKTKSASNIDWSKSDSIDLTESTCTSDTKNHENISTLTKEISSAVKLPNFADRLSTIRKSSHEAGRWFPYAYEVVIMQWSTFLTEQRKSGEKFPSVVDESLNQAAMRAIGVTVASAPMLFEVIKQSLGFRVKCLFDTILSKQDLRRTPPLVSLDDSLLLNLLQVVSMLTDACIDSRNFDSWELRQMSIDVNDSIIRFLRDLFSFLSPNCVHRLILAYLSRFLTKEGKHFDRDSLIGLRCSWEITKLRLNAVTAFVRYPDFIKVNGPQMLNWDRWWTGIPPNFKIDFFDEILNEYAKYCLPEFVKVEGIVPNDSILPKMTPHWLAEIAVDICISGTEHAEQYIQHRSSSLLYEMLWSCSQKCILSGISAPVASMFITIIEKIATNASYISNFSPKSQIRKDTLISAIFVLQSAPPNLLRALWRRLTFRLSRRLKDDIYFSVKENNVPHHHVVDSVAENNEIQEPNVLSIFSILNLSLRTLEYEGSDENIESESSGENRVNIETWRNEYLLSKNQDKRQHSDRERTAADDAEYSTSPSRQWQSHDGSMVIVNTGHQIVLEMNSLLTKAFNGRKFSNLLTYSSWNCYRREVPTQYDSTVRRGSSPFSFHDTVLFVRGVTSVYLQALALRYSDIVVAKALEFSAKVIEIFGIKIFIEAVGETLQHWMRVISFHCGARRALVRIEATDLLELLLRSTWDCFGSFFRIRVPLLAVQTEVMERIVAIAAARYYRDQRRLGTTTFENFTNLGAEASLVPLWRSLDRIQKRPASQQIAYKRALIRIAGKLKNLYRAYVAARVLSFLRSNSDRVLDDDQVDGESVDFNPDSRVRALQISILRVINASDGYSKLFLGLQGTSQQRNSVAHYEAAEDALIAAANVFSPTELPDHRVAWLRMLANFHHSRKKYAEEASCHFSIHVTLHLAAKLHGSLWSNTAFLPWTDNTPNPIVYIDSDAAPAADPDCSSESNLEDWDIGGHPDSSSSFRRIFYRVANSIGFGNNEWESGESKTLFNGISFATEYDTVSPWMTLREMEEDMVEEVEAAGVLFLRAGIVDSSRFSWNIATQHYAEKFNYAKLVNAYSNLARVVISHVPSIDTSLPQEVTTTLGRFYRVWFHGGAPDDLNGVEFVYRSTARLKEFGEELRSVIMSIIPSKTPINLVFDGAMEETTEETTTLTGYRLGQVPLEPVKIKITPLRPLFDRCARTRGLPEWFHHYTDEMFAGPQSPHNNEATKQDVSKRIDSTRSVPGEGYDPHHTQGSSINAALFSSVGSSVVAPVGYHLNSIQNTSEVERSSRFTEPSEGDLVGVDKFCFVQPKNRTRPMEWWKPSAGDFAEKSLRVTQLQVAESFPACVTRQTVAHRLVFSQCPLEAGIDSVCQWCSILFQTAVATAGMSVLKATYDPGIGPDAAKIVADCIHNSRVKEIGLTLLKEPTEQQDRNTSDFTTMESGRLSDDEIAKLQVKLARLIVAFVELLHLLIGRNRDMLLEVIQDRKKSDNGIVIPGGGGTIGRSLARQTSTGQRSEGLRKAGSVGPHTIDPTAPATTTMQHRRNYTDISIKSEDARGRSLHHFPLGSEDNQSYQSVMTSAGVRTESAIAVQSELQRAFINLTKTLYKNVHRKLLDDTPRWFKQIGQDSYFSLGTYLQTKIPIAEEMCFMGFDVLQSDAGSQHPFTYVPSFHSEQGYDSPRGGSIAGGSQTGSVISKGSEQYGYGQF